MPPARSGPTDLSFRLTGWSACSVDRSDLASWRTWAATPESSTADAAPFFDAAPLSGMLRRRATPLGRTALAAALGIPDVETARYVLSTRHGEFSRTVSLLESLADREAPSPADFSMSVHHALSGLLSMAVKNRGRHTAVSGGPESFGYGLIEAATCVATCPDEPVIQLHFDEPPGGGFSDLLPPPEREAPLVLALGLAGISTGNGVPMRLAAIPGAGADAGPSLALEFIRFILNGAPEAVVAGQRMDWRWRRG